MQSSHHQFLKPSLPADDHRFEFELYTIPGNSSWFSWDNIHEIEKVSLKEFFDGSSFTRNPRVYKDYRDFIISKYREDPSRRLTFSEVRKSLVGDVNYLHKVFLFLEKWGLINFGASSPSSGSGSGGDLADKDEKWKVRVEEGPPHGVRVVAVPNSLKPVSMPASVDSNKCSRLAESDFKMPPLSSHSDVYQELTGLVCGNCKQRCESGHYEYTKEENSVICIKCFKNGDYGKNRSIDDYKFVDCTPDNGNHVAVWTEAETLLLLESVLKHGDDWDLVAQSVQTKSKLDCISKLIQLPFGQLMLGSAYDRCRYWESCSSVNSMKQGQGDLPAPQETTDVGTQHVNLESKTQHNGDADSQGPPQKRLCATPISDTGNSKMEQTECEDEQAPPSLIVSEEVMETESQVCELKSQKQQDGDVEDPCSPKTDRSVPTTDISNSLMQQVAHISAIVGPHVTASAAEAAIVALCDENQLPREIFDCEENGSEIQISSLSNEFERIPQGNGSEMDARPNQSEKSGIPLPLRMRATTATALGAAAANAKLLAIQEDKEIEHLVSTIISAQMKKLKLKMKLLKEAEEIMEKELSQMEEVKETVLTERMNAIQKIIEGGISRWRDRTCVKPQPQTEIILN